jgi:hypothetical protein
MFLNILFGVEEFPPETLQMDVVGRLASDLHHKGRLLPNSTTPTHHHSIPKAFISELKGGM